MIKFAVTTVINRSVDEVFAFMTDVRNEPKWIPGVLEAEQTSEGPVGVGTTYYELVELLGQQVELTFEVTEYEANRKFSARSTVGLFDGSVMNTFEAVAGGTQITLVTEGEPTGIFKMFESLIARWVQEQAEGAFANAKRMLEAG